MPPAVRAQVDLHTPNLEASTLDWGGLSQDALFFLPGAAKLPVVRMYPHAVQCQLAWCSRAHSRYLHAPDSRDQGTRAEHF